MIIFCRSSAVLCYEICGRIHSDAADPKVNLMFGSKTRSSFGLGCAMQFSLECLDSLWWPVPTYSTSKYAISAIYI